MARHSTATPARDGRQRRRRGSTTLFVLCLATLLAVVGVSVVVAQRLELRRTMGANEAEEAKGLAFSAAEHALACIASDPNWRTTYTNNVSIPPITFGRGQFTWKLVDTDGDLADRDKDDATLYVTGIGGATVRVLSVHLDSPDPPAVAPDPTSWAWEVLP